MASLTAFCGDAMELMFCSILCIRGSTGLSIGRRREGWGAVWQFEGGLYLSSPSRFSTNLVLHKEESFARM